MFEALDDILTFFPNSLIGSLFIGAVSPLLGVFFIMRRMTFLGIAVPQFSAAGMAVGFMLMEPWSDWVGHHDHGNEIESHFAFLLACACVGTLIVLALLISPGRRGGANHDGRIATAYAVTASTTILCLAGSSLGKSHLDVLLRGEILAIDDGQLYTIIGAFSAVFVMFGLTQRDWLAVAADREFAISLGKNPRLWDLGFYLICGTAISVAVLTTGPLVVFGLMILPAMAARQIAFNMTSLYVFASAFGILSAFIGLLASYQLDWPLGPTDVVVAFGGLLLAWGVGAAKRWATKGAASRG